MKTTAQQRFGNYIQFFKKYSIKTIASILLTLINIILYIRCKNKKGYFPDRQSMLTAEFSDYENFFPLVSLDLTKKGINDIIHLMYVSFDSGIDSDTCFPGDENVDAFSFKILDNGLYQPTFNKSALEIEKSFEPYFKEEQQKYIEAKTKNNAYSLVTFPKQPRWWQYDQTPVNSKGKTMQFICQLHIDYIFNDYCLLNVFYDKDDKIVTYIYQRT
jgi:hypothetical protein